ncbi:hypothetical protein PQX77_015362 [Marasmius sp. AFHP31]|nr:hypothetical protein PQX77_015362 [Marasmius sp. AFHP31]
MTGALPVLLDQGYHHRSGNEDAWELYAWAICSAQMATVPGIRAALRGSTLTGTHPLRVLFPLGLSQRADRHPLSMTSRPHPRAKKIVGPIPDMVATMPEVTEWFDLADGLAAPGNRIRDSFPDRICFDKSPRASDQETEGESRSDYLDRLLSGCEWDPEGIVVATDASVPSSTRHHSVAGFEAYVGGERVFGCRFASGRILAACAELVAICFAVTRVTSGAEPYKRITVFTDSIAAAERAVDPSLHSGQAHSLAVCKALNEWLREDDDREIKFVEVPSSAKWSVHHSAHLFVRGLPPVGVGSAPQTSLNCLCKRATDACQDTWVTRFQEAKYKGGQFLELNNLKGKPLQPKYTSGGTWLPHIGHTNSLTSRVIRCITNHAPVGEYYRRFHIPESEDCRCGHALETHLHMLFRCPQAACTGPIRYLGDLVNFLEANPRVFAMRNQIPRAGVG